MLLNVCFLALRLLFLNIYQKHKYGMAASHRMTLYLIA